MSEKATDKRPPKRFASIPQVVGLGIYLMVLGLLLIRTIFGIWPPVSPQPDQRDASRVTEAMARVTAAEGANPVDPAAVSKARSEVAAELEKFSKSAAAAPASEIEVSYGAKLGFKINVTWEQRLLLIVILMGALGSWLHASSSFVAYVGARNFISSWFWWYLIRPLIGSGLALVFYFVIRGGLLAANTEGSSVSHYGVAAFAALAGLFTERATRKLQELFETLFKTDDRPPDKLTEAPAGVQLEVKAGTVVKAGAAGQAVEITGGGFSDKTTAQVGGQKRTVTLVDDKTIQVALEAADVAQAGKVEITTQNPEGEVVIAVQ